MQKGQGGLDGDVLEEIERQDGSVENEDDADVSKGFTSFALGPTQNSLSNSGLGLRIRKNFYPKNSVLPLGGVVHASSRISSLTKLFNVSEKPPFQLKLPDGIQWENIPLFAVVTGINGSGKTTLVKRFSVANQSAGVLYIPTTYRFDHISSTGTGSKDASYHMRDIEAMRAMVDKIHSEINIESASEQKDKSPSVTPEFPRKESDKKDENKELIERIKKHHPELKPGDFTREIIKEEAQRFVEYNPVNIQDPIAIFNQVILVYQQALQRRKFQARDISSIKSLYEFSRKKSPELTYPDFVTKLADDSVFLDGLVSSYALQIETSPVDEMNKILRRYCFKYQVALTDERNEQKIIFTRGHINIQLADLSDGERMAFALFSWLFYLRGLVAEESSNDKKLNHRVSAIFLDEPDAHLDSVLCKLMFEILYQEFTLREKIQVIMTSHRSDTVTLAPSKSIFIIEEDKGQFRVEPAHKLRVLFRMTKNIGPLVDFHHKVYAEATSDALFYQGIYNSIRNKLCDNVKMANKFEGITGNDRHLWVANDQISRRILSRRYQMAFFSTCEHPENRNGSCQKVKEYVKRDQTAYESLASGKIVDDVNNGRSQHWLNSKKVFDHPGLFKSYGVLDNDNGFNWKLKEDKLEEQIIVMSTRHSLENFLLDPIIFCAMLEENEIDQFVQGTQLGNAEKVNLVAVCCEIRRLIKGGQISLVQSLITEYHKVIVGCVCDCYENLHPKEREKDNFKPYAEFYESLLEKMTSQSTLEFESILCDQAVVIINLEDAKVHRLFYPAELLRIKGHHLEELFFDSKKNKNMCNYKDVLISRILNEGIDFVPLDLAQIFFDLNDKIRTNDRSIIRP